MLTKKLKRLIYKMKLRKLIEEYSNTYKIRLGSGKVFNFELFKNPSEKELKKCFYLGYIRGIILKNGDWYVARKFLEDNENKVLFHTELLRVLDEADIIKYEPRYYDIFAVKKFLAIETKKENSITEWVVSESYPVGIFGKENVEKFKEYVKEYQKKFKYKIHGEFDDI